MQRLANACGLWLSGLIGLLMSAWLVVANPPNGSYNMTPTKAPPPPPPVGNIQPVAATTSVMDHPLRLANEAARTFQTVQDYTCLFIKTEQVNGRLQPENVMTMKVRNQPFSVYMKWHSPKTLTGQEVAYVAGRNNGMMRVHATGFRGAIGFISMDLRDPRAMENNRHTINEAGIGNLITRLQQNWEMERRVNKTQVRAADYDYARRKCVRIETIHPDNAGQQFYSYRTVVYFDKENNLPIRFETYDWPRKGGAAEGELLECYSYVDLRFNVGLGDDAFRY